MPDAATLQELFGAARTGAAGHRRRTQRRAGDEPASPRTTCLAARRPARAGAGGGRWLNPLWRAPALPLHARPSRPGRLRDRHASPAGSTSCSSATRRLDARRVLDRAPPSLQAVCADAGVPFVLNDRPDLALELGADGVHVGQDDAPPALARRILGPDAIVGLSRPTPPDELDAAADEPVDYVSTGPVNETPTKAGRPGHGPRVPPLRRHDHTAPVLRHRRCHPRDAPGHARSRRPSVRRRRGT